MTHVCIIATNSLDSNNSKFSKGSMLKNLGKTVDVFLPLGNRNKEPVGSCKIVYVLDNGNNFYKLIGHIELDEMYRHYTVAPTYILGSKEKVGFYSVHHDCEIVKIMLSYQSLNCDPQCVIFPLDLQESKSEHKCIKCSLKLGVEESSEGQHTCAACKTVQNTLGNHIKYNV